jgi:hypothetical protein
MRLTPESLMVESFPTTGVPDTEGLASSIFTNEDCSTACDHATCYYELC